MSGEITATAGNTGVEFMATPFDKVALTYFVGVSF